MKVNVEICASLINYFVIKILSGKREKGRTGETENNFCSTSIRVFAELLLQLGRLHDK
jgi:hypothetical protein